MFLNISRIFYLPIVFIVAIFKDNPLITELW